ncbi:MAG: glycosyltransferase family 2 protein [Pseudomonadota bacterium]
MTYSAAISIVMPSFNHAEFIKRSIQSVLSQDLAPIEIIIQDGGSTDGTLGILAEMAVEEARICWHSKPDSGPAEAINRALARTRGTIIGWLNSDDLYTSGAVQRAVEALADPKLLMVYGHGDHIDKAGAHLSKYPTRLPAAGLSGFASGCFICQPTMFFKRTAHTLLGPLDETLKTSFDMDYWMRAFSRFPDRIGFIDAVQARSRLHDECITQNQRKMVAAEAIALTKRYLGVAEPHWATTHLEEIARDARMSSSGEDVRQIMESFLEEVEPHLGSEITQRLRRQLPNEIAPPREAAPRLT